MLTYNLEEKNKPLYEQLYSCIKEDIINGILESNEQLPSKRSFARHLGVSTITVENAYDQLISEGYMYAIEKKGYYVADISLIHKIKKTKIKRDDIILPSAFLNYRYDLSGNQVNTNTFPFSIWAKLMRETISDESDKLMKKSFCSGVESLREAIALHLASFRGMSVDPNQIIIGAGTEYLYSMLLLILGKDKRYCVENPGYKKILDIYKMNGADCSYVDMDEDGIIVKGLIDNNADVAHISPTHHFPTGITMPVSRRYELLAWANAVSGRYIIEDDYDSEFRLNGKPIPTLYSIDACGKVIYVNTFSKSLAPTIRVSYMVLPVELANLYYERFSFYSCTVSNFEQYTLAKFIKLGYFEKHINRMRLYYIRQRAKVMEALKKSSLNNSCKVIENNSGLHFVLEFDTQLEDEVLKASLIENDIYISAISEYLHDGKKKTGESHRFIINYSNLDTDKLIEVFNLIDSLL
ncbi:MAG: PLP-dependent aminotransferase family protein [Lachnospiraceae bacterium]|nr:PLP-dependent aminotransferase family protein [Lachnospiraceae bacterium]